MQVPKVSRGSSYCALLVLVLPWVAGCGSSSATTMVGPSPVRCQVQVSQTSSAFGASGGTGQLTVSAARECQWAAVAQADWIALAQASGQGDGSVQYAVRPNPSPTERRASIVVEGQTVEVSQDAAPCTFELDHQSDEQPSTGGTGVIGVRTHAACGWTASSDVPWIVITAGRGGTGSGSVRYATSPNPGSARTGRVTIAGSIVEIRQAAVGTPAPPPQPAPDPGSPAPDPGSPPPDPGSPPPDPGTPPSDQGTPPADACRYDISPSDVSIGAAETDGIVRVTASRADCAWNATSSAPWLTITAGVSGSGDGDVRWAAATNTDSAPRTGALAIATHTFTVHQAGSAPVQVTLTGVVSDLGGTCPAVTFVVDRTRVTTTASTTFQRGNCRHVENGLSVQVTGLRQADGSVQAQTVELRRQAAEGVE
jgi:hypothetical protein